MGHQRVLALILVLAAIGASAAPAAATDDPTPVRASRKRAAVRVTRADDVTFRPTVKIRRGDSAGSGTIIASARGETLVLTAAHVVVGDGPLTVELHRYNLGLERSQPGVGWPRAVAAELVRADAEADVALIRIAGLGRLPYVAALIGAADEPRPGTPVLSFGIDLGEELSRWETTVRGLVRLNRGGDGKARPFLVTEKAPEHGRSGGGLFRDDGRVIGVCVGRIEMAGGKAVGLFASPSSVRALLDDPAAAAVIARHPALLPAAADPRH